MYLFLKIKSLLVLAGHIHMHKRWSLHFNCSCNQFRNWLIANAYSNIIGGWKPGVERYCRFSIIQSDWEKILQQARIRSLSYIFFLLSDPEDVEYEDVVSVLRGITLTERERVGQVKSQHSFSPRPVAI